MPESILLDDDESGADRADDGFAGELQPLRLGDRRWTAHIGTFAALGKLLRAIARSIFRVLRVAIDSEEPQAPNADWSQR